MTAQGKCPECHTDLVGCPKCRRIVRNKAVVRQAVVDDVGVTAVGFVCPNCGNEWGLDVETTSTLACPIDGCSWRLHLPSVRRDQINAFGVGLGALELLGHVLGWYGADGRTPHTTDEILAIRVGELAGAAFPDVLVDR